MQEAKEKAKREFEEKKAAAAEGGDGAGDAGGQGEGEARVRGEEGCGCGGEECGQGGKAGREGSSRPLLGELEQQVSRQILLQLYRLHRLVKSSNSRWNGRWTSSCIAA